MHLYGEAVRGAITEAVPEVVLVGNPNVGKSALFGLLTGRYVTVSNYPGTTVEVAQGNAEIHHRRYLIVDTPGINSLLPMSEEERVTRDILLAERPAAVLQVADAKNLRRGLLLTVQLAEMQVPLVLILNMEDEARALEIRIEQTRLSALLGVAVRATVAVRREGIEGVRQALEQPRIPEVSVVYESPIEKAIAALERLLPAGPIARRSLALMVLAGDRTLLQWLRSRLSEEAIGELERLRLEAQRHYMEPLGYVMTQQRLRVVDLILREVMTAPARSVGTKGETLGRWAMHPLWGWPFLAMVLFLLYEVVGVFGAQTLVDLLEEGFFGAVVNPLAARAVEWLVPWLWARELLVGEYGLVTMALTYAIAIVLPIVGMFFLAFGLLEDSGYLPRLAIMLNRIFRTMGLNGKAVLPMVLGLGCVTMATLTTRILETRKERVLATLLLALGVPCSAQLGVILGLLGGLSPWAFLVWGGTVVGTLLLVGFLAARLVPGAHSDFVLEVPPLRVPQVSNIAIKTGARVKWYLREAVPFFLLGTFLLFVLDKTGALASIQALASPLVEGLLGLPAKATEAFLVGFLRRDYGAAGLYALAQAGALDSVQVVVSLVTITLFVPCVANFFMVIKERGVITALGIVAFIVPFAFAVGGALNLVLRGVGAGF